jgi:hypothetical protein
MNEDNEWLNEWMNFTRLILHIFREVDTYKQFSANQLQ